jgi:PLP dependent protein
MTNIADNAKKIMEHVVSAAVDAGREPSDISVLAATKYTDRAGVETLMNAGIMLIGENRVQDAIAKLTETHEHPDIHKSFPGCHVHMIGSLQANKINQALKLFDLVETVDRPALAEALEKRIDRDRVLPVLIEVHLTEEESKTGSPVENLPELIDYVACKCPHLSLRGLMGMGPWDPDPETARPYYRRLHALFDLYRAESSDPENFNILSMGMSADFHVAIQEGATVVRIGRALFE